MIVNLLVGSLIGAWFGASWAIHLRTEAFYRIIALLLLLSGADIKLAGSLSLAVGLPTIIVAFTRYSQDRSFIGEQLLGIVPSAVLLPILAVILVLSAVKIWRHR